MRRKLQWTLPVGPPGAKIAFDIMLEARILGTQNCLCKAVEGGWEYIADVLYDDVEELAHNAMTVFPVRQIDFLDLDAGLHFTITRRSIMRRTGDDR